MQLVGSLRHRLRQTIRDIQLASNLDEYKLTRFNILAENNRTALKPNRPTDRRNRFRDEYRRLRVTKDRDWYVRVVDMPLAEQPINRYR